MRDAWSMRWVAIALIAFIGCGDDDDSVAVRVLDGGAPDVAPSGPTDAGADVHFIPPDPFVPPAPNPYWRIEHPPDSKRTWMVSPEGARTFVLGVDSVFREDECDGIATYIHRSPDAALTEWRRLSETYGFNAIGPFGALDVEGAPYSLVVSLEPRGDDRALRDANGDVLRTGLSSVKVGDPYAPGFIADVKAALHETVESHSFDKRLQIIYLGHETGMFDLAGPGGGIRDFRRWIWSDCPPPSTTQKPLCAPDALVRFLNTIYPNIAALNSAWATAHATFEAVAAARPVPATANCNATCGSDLQRFILEDLLPTWVRVVSLNARAFAPKHIIASPRLALGTPAQFHFYRAGDTFADDGQPIGSYDPYPVLSKFDLVALDVYSGAPTYEEPWLSDGIHGLQADSQLPVIVSEMGTRVAIAGWSNQGGPPAFVATDAERAERYASQLAQLSAVPDLVGVVWHAWSDRYVGADATRQLHEGIVQCDDKTRGFVAGSAWSDFVGGVATANHNAIKIE